MGVILRTAAEGVRSRTLEFFILAELWRGLPSSIALAPPVCTGIRLHQELEGVLEFLAINVE